jgi:hypothetical protein
MSEFSRPSLIGNAHVCNIDCVPTADGRHILYPALPTIDAGRYQWELNSRMTRREYRASGQDETRACRVWAAERAWRLKLERWGDVSPALGSRKRVRAARELYYSGRERFADLGTGL